MYPTLLLFASVGGTMLVLILSAGVLVRRIGNSLSEDPIDVDQ